MKKILFLIIMTVTTLAMAAESSEYKYAMVGIGGLPLPIVELAYGKRTIEGKNALNVTVSYKTLLKYYNSIDYTISYLRYFNNHFYGQIGLRPVLSVSNYKMLRINHEFYPLYIGKQKTDLRVDIPIALGYEFTHKDRINFIQLEPEYIYSTTLQDVPKTTFSLAIKYGIQI